MRLLINATLLATTVTALCTSCYRMPTEDDYSLVPLTNNPSITRQREEAPMPQASY